MASQEMPATLVLACNTAADDPEGPAMYERICRSSRERIIVIAADDPLLINALQRRAAVALKKSLREGFGLTVSEAMWKGRAVIGGNVWRHRASDHQRAIGLPRQQCRRGCWPHHGPPPMMRRNLGRRARGRVRRHFLMLRLLEDWPDLIAGLTLRSRTRSSAQELATSA
jgi:trehalose synthase